MGSRAADRPPRGRPLPEAAALMMRCELDESLRAAMDAADTPEGYLPWRRFRHRPVPEGIDVESLWSAVHMRRLGRRKLLPLLRDRTGAPFWFVESDAATAALHRIDTRESLWERTVGLVPLGRRDPSYVLRTLEEEAYSSSAIEGAVTTRRRAHELIRSGQTPRDRSERMVLDNYRTVERMEEWADEPLSPELLLSIQASVTADTLDEAHDEGSFRTDDDVWIVDASSGEVAFVPPTYVELPERMDRLCEFANQPPDTLPFVHPVIRAILLHHQLAYDHPFGDGNGRTARALFMWSMLRSGYWWLRSLSISRSIHRSREAYYRSFVDTQQHERDVTYFVRHQFGCLERELELQARFLGRRVRLAQRAKEKTHIEADLNPRQLAALEYSVARPDGELTFESHQSMHGVTYPTAWKDLTGMAELGLLIRTKRGKRFVFRPSGKLDALRA